LNKNILNINKKFFNTSKGEKIDGISINITGVNEDEEKY